jgi:hypothetical protein
LPDFLVAAGADPGRIRLVFSGAPAPAHFGRRSDDRHAALPQLSRVPGWTRSRMRLRVARRVRSVPARSVQSRPAADHRPCFLSFSTLLGNGSLVGTALDAAGNVYIAGNTTALDFPVTANAFQYTPGGANCAPPFGGSLPCSDIFVAKLSGDGRTLVYATYLGGPGDDFVKAMVLGPNGNLYFTATYSTNWLPNLTLLPGQTAGSRVYAAALSADGSSLVFAAALPLGFPSQARRRRYFMPARRLGSPDSTR